MSFRQTWLLAQGQVITNAAVFLLVETDLAVSEVTFAHFSPTATRVVVTAAIPEKRRILELNAEPAAAEYARLTGIAPDALTPSEFARHPLLLRMGRHHHRRRHHHYHHQTIPEWDSVERPSWDGSLLFLLLGRREGKRRLDFRSFVFFLGM